MPGVANSAAYAQQQQQQMLQRQAIVQHQQAQARAAQAQAQAQAASAASAATPPNAAVPAPPGDVVDGNDAYRNAKRLKPTSRALPSFTASGATLHDSSQTELKLAPSTRALQSLSASYKQLQDIERKLDWNVTRRRAELSETLMAAPARANSIAAGIRRTLRVHVTTSLHSQPWQASAEDKAALTDAAKSESEPAIDFTTGQGVPRFELKLTGEVLGLPEGKGKSLTQCLTRAVIETNRDPALYDKTGPVDWHRASQAPPMPSGLSASFPATTSTNIRISLYIDHQPNRYALPPDIANLLDLPEADRTTVLQALWSYIKINGLQDEDQRHVRTDARLRKAFAGQERVPFHHLPEYVNRLLAPAAPVVINHTINVDEKAGAIQHHAFDVQISTEDPARAEMDRVLQTLSAPNERTSRIVALDEKIALDAVAIRNADQKRTFLIAFASNPVTTIQSYLASQARDLDLVLGHDRAHQASIGGGATWREEIRRADLWNGEWVKEGASVFASRKMEGVIREATAQAQQQQQQALAQQQGGQRAVYGALPSQQQGLPQQQQQMYGTPQNYGRR